MLEQIATDEEILSRPGIMAWDQFINFGISINLCLTTFPNSTTHMERCNGDANQQFEYATDYTVRNTRTKECLTQKPISVNETILTMEPCSDKSSRWGHEATNQYIEVQSLLCLTNDHYIVKLKKCRGASSQQWRFTKSIGRYDTLLLDSKQIRILHKQGNITNALPPVRESLYIPTPTPSQVIESIVEEPIMSLPTNTPSPTTHPIANLSDEVKKIIHSLHAEFKAGLEIIHENKLAAEVREVYCEVSRIKRHLAIGIAQTNGFLAASILKMGQCARIQGSGELLSLQQCKKIRVDIRAIETQCGFQPFHTYKGVNYTIGIDGWSLHPYQECFWSFGFVNLNGKTYSWEPNNVSLGEWIEQIPTIHMNQLKLIAGFKEIVLNDYDFSLRAHPAHQSNELEQLNVLTELIGRIQETRNNPLSKVVMSVRQENQMLDLFSWSKHIRIIVISVIGFIATVTFAACLIKPCSYASNALRQYQVINKKMDNKKDDTLPSAPLNNDIEHQHTKCTYIVGKGLVWEDSCPCSV